PTPMPIPPKITTSRAMIANPRRISDLLRLASVSTMPPRCEGLMKERRRSRRAPPCDDAACERGARDVPAGRHRERGRLAHPEHLSDIEISVGGDRGLPDRSTIVPTVRQADPRAPSQRGDRPSRRVDPILQV